MNRHKNKEKLRELREIISSAAVCSSDGISVYNRDVEGIDYYIGSKDGRVCHYSFYYHGPWVAVKDLPIHLIKELLEAEWKPRRPISALEALARSSG